MFCTSHLGRKVGTVSEGAEQRGSYRRLINRDFYQKSKTRTWLSSCHCLPLLPDAQFFLTAGSLNYYPPVIKADEFKKKKATQQNNLEQCCIRPSTCPPGSFQVANTSSLQQWRRWNLAYLVTSCLLLAHLAAPLLSTENNSRHSKLLRLFLIIWILPLNSCYSELGPPTTGSHALITKSFAICSLSLDYSFSHSHMNLVWVTNPPQLLSLFFVLTQTKL